MNQSKLEMVKQEMARVNIYTWVISELKWTGMGEFNSYDHCIYYCGQVSLKWSSSHSQQKILKCSTWVQSQKQQNDLCLSSIPPPHGKPYNITVMQVYAPDTNAKEADIKWL